MNNNGTDASHQATACVIGGGWSGLYAAKTLKGLGYHVTILESRSKVGGIWNLTDDGVKTASHFTELTSSKVVTQAHDFPYLPSMGDFPSAGEIRGYLEAYCRKFDLTVQFGKHVTKIEKTNTESSSANEKWMVVVDDGSEYSCDRLVLALGLPGTSRMNDNEFRNFSGQRYTYGDFKTTDDMKVLCGKKVLVVGGGESAAEILLHLASVCAPNCHWSSRGFHGFRKRGFQITPNIMAYDAIDAKFYTAVTGFFRFGKTGLRNVCALCSSGNLLYPQGHSVAQFERKARWGTLFFTKNTEVLQTVGKEIFARPPVKSVEKNKVVFQDGTEESYDAIVLCIGGKYCPPEFAKDLPMPKDCFKYVLNMKDPTMAYIGMVRPTITSFPLMTEYSCAILEEFWALDSPSLPSSETLKGEQADFCRLLKIHFENQVSERLDTLVDPVVYWAATRGKYTSKIPYIERYDRTFMWRLLSPSTYLVPALAGSLLDEIIHVSSSILPDPVKRLFTTHADKSIYLTKTPHCKDTVEFWRSRGYTVHEVDEEFERTQWKYVPMIKSSLTLVVVIAMEIVLWHQFVNYRLLALLRLGWIVYHVLEWHYQLLTLA